MPSGEYDDNIKAPTYAGSTPEQRKGLTKWLNLMTGQLELTTKCEEQALLGWQLWWGVASFVRSCHSFGLGHAVKHFDSNEASEMVGGCPSGCEVE